MRRFTPTGVGTMSSFFSAFASTSVHPHGRGDNRHFVLECELCIGSPPRAWGQFYGRHARYVCRRFTPTGVGTIAPASAERSELTVHPHGRGDNTSCGSSSGSASGSPPRAWGQLNSEGEGSVTTRFTPTGVGTIGRVRLWKSRTTVHPHGRGDNVFILFEGEDGRGSPPRAWGQCANG